MNNLKQLGLAILNYESQVGCLPMGGITYAESPVNCEIANRTFSLFDLILPQMEESTIYNAANFSHTAGGTDESGVSGGAINHTAFSARSPRMFAHRTLSKRPIRTRPSR